MVYFMTKTLTQSELKSVLKYNKRTGVFTWAKDIGCKMKQGDIAGCNLTLFGITYRSIRMSPKQYLAHRLAWLYIYGEFPKNQIDHINGDGTDNRIVNLRDVTAAENMKNQTIYKNNTSGAVGVRWNKRDRKWRAHINNNKKQIHLGSFDEKSEAVKARKEAEIKFGYHQNHGKEKVIL